MFTATRNGLSVSWLTVLTIRPLSPVSYTHLDAVYSAVFDNLREMNIGYFLYVGGNDSMDTVDKLSRFAARTDSDCLLYTSWTDGRIPPLATVPHICPEFLGLLKKHPC